MKREATKLRVDRPLILCVFVALLGLSQFLVAVPIAMQQYAGGSLHDTDSHGYSWANNWLSDLGRNQAWNGEQNAGSAMLFNSSIIGFGFSLAVFFVASIRAREEISVVDLANAAAGVLAASGLIGIGLTPFDRFHKLHIACLLLWCIPMVLVAIISSVQTLRSGSILAVLLTQASVVLVVGMVVYAMSSTTSGVMTMQKIVVLISLAWFALLMVHVGLTAVYVIVETRSRYQIANEQAGEYMNRIRRGHLKPYERHDP